MRHTCEHCAIAYEISDDKVAGRFVKVRCKACSGTMHVVGLRPLDAQGAEGAVWWCAIGNVPRGPYADDEVSRLIAAGDVHARTRMWRSGMAGWERVCESEHLAWVYMEVIEAAAGAWSDAAQPSCVFDRAALLSDGCGYFPDPTLKSGIIVLDTTVQRQLESLARRNGILPGAPADVATSDGARVAEPRSPAADARASTPTSLWPSIAAAALGCVAAAAGVAWFVAAPPV